MKMKNGKWKMKNGKWKMKMENGRLETNSPFSHWEAGNWSFAKTENLKIGNINVEK